MLLRCPEFKTHFVLFLAHPHELLISRLGLDYRRTSSDGRGRVVRVSILVDSWPTLNVVSIRGRLDQFSRRVCILQPVLEKLGALAQGRMLGRLDQLAKALLLRCSCPDRVQIGTHLLLVNRLFGFFESVAG